MRTPLLDVMKPHLRQGVERATAMGASAAKLTFSHGESIGCSFESGRLKSSGTQENLGYTVTVIVDGRRGIATGNALDDVEAMVLRAMDLAKAGSDSHFTTYPAPRDCRPVRTFSGRTLDLSRAAMIEACDGIVRKLKDVDGDLDIEAGANRVESETLMVTSGGVCHAGTRTSWSLGAGVQRTRDTDMLFAHAGRSWCDLNAFFDPDFLFGRIQRDLAWSERSAEPPSGITEVYLPPEALARFLVPILAGLNGRNVAKGTSPLRGHLHEQFFDPALTIVDDPHVPFCPGAAELDSAGIPTRRTAIVENGVIQTFLYDLDSAGLAGVQPTGHSDCSPYSPEIEPGDTPSEELLSTVADGLYIRHLLGFGQSNIANGDFSANVALGYRVKQGRIEGRVKNTMVAGNLFEIFRQGVRLSSDRDPLTRMPHAVVNGITVHGSQG